MALVIDQIGDGGAGQSVLKLAHGFGEAGVNAHIITLRARGVHSVRDGLKVDSLPSPRSNLLLLRRRHEARELRRALMCIAPGGELALLPTVAFLRDAHRAVVAADLPKRSTFVSLRTSVQGDLARKHGWAHRRLRKWFQSLLEGQQVIACSRAILDELRELAITPAAAWAIYNPYEFERIRTLAEEPAEIPMGPYLIHVGRDHSQKRHDLLLEAFASVPAPIKLVLLGEHGEALSKRIRKMGLDSRVYQAGFQANPFPWMKNAEAMVCSSDFEGFPNVLVESLILGTPCVSTDCPTGPREILRGTSVSELVPVGDCAALAAGMIRVLKKNSRETESPILKRVSTQSIVSEYMRAMGLDLT